MTFWIGAFLDFSSLEDSHKFYAIHMFVLLCYHLTHEVAILTGNAMVRSCLDYCYSLLKFLPTLAPEYSELEIGRIDMRNVHPKGSMSFILKLGQNWQV